MNALKAAVKMYICFSKNKIKSYTHPKKKKAHNHNEFVHISQ